MTPLSVTRIAAIASALIAGCAATPTATTLAPPPELAPSAPVAATQARCPAGARIMFQEIRADGSSISLGLHCGRTHEVEVGEYYEWGEGGSERIAVSSGEAAAIWQIAQESRWRTWRTCEHEGARPRWVVEIDDGSMALLYAHCDGGLPAAWSATVDALRRPEPEPFVWPFDSEYWRDELGYHRSARR